MKIKGVLTTEFAYEESGENLGFKNVVYCTVECNLPEGKYFKFRIYFSHPLFAKYSNGDFDNKLVEFDTDAGKGEEIKLIQ